MTPWAGAAPTTPPLGLVLIPSGKHAAFRDWDAPSLAGCPCQVNPKHRAERGAA